MKKCIKGIILLLMMSYGTISLSEYFVVVNENYIAQTMFPR